MKAFQKYLLVIGLLAVTTMGNAQPVTSLEDHFRNPPASARPWVFWYWMQAAVSKEGITADLEAMKQVGIGGAYLMPIKDTTSPPLMQPVARQLTPEWWTLVNFAIEEARRLDLKLAIHVSDGFALAGGPWITPELSMQKLVWSKTYIKGGKVIEQVLAKPPIKAGYYKDIAVMAYPANSSTAFEDMVLVPTVTTSNGAKASFLSFEGDDKESFRSDSTCWIQYKYPAPFTCRSIRIHTGGNNYQAQRLIIQAGDNGTDFKTITRLDPPRHGWQDTDEDVTYSIPATTARYFRFVYDKKGSEPGAEDLDAAKWRPSLKVNGIYLSDEPVIHQYESKNGSIWRISKPTSNTQVPPASAIPLRKVIDLTGKMDENGKLQWTPPAGNWVIVRIGHTSTGHTNATGGGGKGLECDKFNPAAIQLQFDNWFARVLAQPNAKDVVTMLHVDSWECGSQNWSPLFAEAFKKRRGYDLRPWLLAMTGVPLENGKASEKFLHDVRQTIAELVNEVFYATLRKLAAQKGCAFSAESVAPTMVSDGLLHYKNVDIPMGEFWLNSPTHDKPNDMLDAISAAHIYGKKIIQAEAFTSVRMNWGEHPGNLKTIGDRNFALGINKMVLHVYTHNPWLNRKPGMTLDGVGLYFQRDQTWFKAGKAWIDYLARVQSLLQSGEPVADIAVFTGEEVPRRSILPDRLVETLPGIFGQKKRQEEQARIANEGQPLRTIPSGVTHSANMADPEDWIDPLNGYSYDSFNPDALLQATVKKGRIVFPGGSYAMLVLPHKHVMQPNNTAMSVAVAKKLVQLAKNGATILMSNHYQQSVGWKEKDDSVKLLLRALTGIGKKSRVVGVPYTDSTFAKLGLQRDVFIENNDHTIAWTHRRVDSADIYFISNQKDSTRWINISFRVTGKRPEIWHPVTGKQEEARLWSIGKERTSFPLLMEANGAVLIVFRKKTRDTIPGPNYGRGIFTSREHFSKPWSAQFDPSFGGPASPIVFDRLRSWSLHSDSMIRHYSGTVVYRNSFEIPANDPARSFSLAIDSIFNIATVKVNGVECGTIWTKPYQIDITKGVRPGNNEVVIEVSNTWANRLIGDQALPPEKRVTWTTAPFRLGGKPLLPAGLVGNVELIKGR